MKMIKELLLTAFIAMTAQCHAGTFDLDTIDNWQVYNGEQMVLAGHGIPASPVFHGTVKISDLKDLAIQFNHCARYSEPFDVTIEIIGDRGQRILKKQLKTNLNERMVIGRNELGTLATKSITIWYYERVKDGVAWKLGEIKLTTQ